MAGKPLARALTASIATAAQAESVDPLTFICNRIAGGQSLSALARELNAPRSAMSTYANGLPGAKEALRVARAEGAHAMVDEARDLLDGVELERDAITVAKAKVELLLWQAARLNQTEFGETKQQVNVQVNVGSLSLDAMRARVMTKPDTLPLDVDIEPNDG